MKRLIAVTLSVFAVVSVMAQDIYTPVLEEIGRNSAKAHLYQKEYESALAENATGLAPENPEVEFGYLWGDKLTGDRKDVSVSQSFDFPTVYSRRSKLSHEKDLSAARLLTSQRNALLLEAKEMLVELVYLNAKRELCRRQLEDATRLSQIYEKMLSLGQTTRIDYNKALLSETGFENDLAQTEVERQALLDRLAILNGGNPVTFDHTEIPAEPLPADFDRWLEEAEHSNPELQYLISQIEVSRRDADLTKAEGLPKLSVGYMGEFVKESNFQGVTIGVSIPLWENRNKVRSAKARTLAAEEAVTAAREDCRATLKSLFSQATALGEMEKRYAASMSDSDNIELLSRALSKGTMTMLEYVNEVQYQYESADRLLQIRRDRELAMARLYSFRL